MKIQGVLCIIAWLAYETHGQGRACTAPDGGTGVCLHNADCKHMDEMIKSYLTASAELQKTIQDEIFERLKACNSNYTERKVCCSDCVTLDGKSGVRKRVRKHPYLHGYIDGSDSSRQGPTLADFCCGPDASRQQPCDCQIGTPPDPNSNCCGVDAYAGEKITGGITTSIYEYPWTVLLEYTIGKKPKVTRCGGALITNQHVVTAAHCVTGGNPEPVSVRVGEFDTNKDGSDFVRLPDGTFEYTDGAESIPVQWTLIHPDYEEWTRRNDIALIKLQNSVKYTDFVRPICLPSAEPDSREQFVAAGWGKNATHKRTVRKQAVNLHFFNNDVCTDTYGLVWEKQICAGGERGKDSCQGDSGGPLMTLVNSEVPHYELAGVISYGQRICGFSALPGVYTRVFSYLDWIKQNAK